MRVYGVSSHQGLEGSSMLIEVYLINIKIDMNIFYNILVLVLKSLFRFFL